MTPLTGIVCSIYTTGQEYYLNIYTKQSQWDKPDKPAENTSSSNSAGPAQVQCSHLLVKHKDSRRPSSWREENITRTEDEALQMVVGTCLPESFATKRFVIFKVLFPSFVQITENTLYRVKRLSRNWPRIIRIVVRLRKEAIWDRSLEAQCNLYSKKPHLIWKLANWANQFEPRRASI